jgi:hypothetical protein
MIKVIKLTSDNFEGQLCTPKAYKLLQSEMSTGDFHTHKHEVVFVEDYTNILTEDMVIEEQAFYAEHCPTCGQCTE